MRRSAHRDYGTFQKHSLVFPMSLRIVALTDRIAFFPDQLDIPA